MAYTAGNLRNEIAAPPGRGSYRYDSTDLVDVVEDAGYFNNLDDNLNLAIGDFIKVLTWSGTPFASGNTITEAKHFVVTNVISNTAAASAGNVNVAEVFISTGLLSSGA